MRGDLVRARALDVLAELADLIGPDSPSREHRKVRRLALDLHRRVEVLGHERVVYPAPLGDPDHPGGADGADGAAGGGDR